MLNAGFLFSLVVSIWKFLDLVVLKNAPGTG